MKGLEPKLFQFAEVECKEGWDTSVGSFKLSALGM